MEEKNKIEELLIELGICDRESIISFYPRVRDRLKVYTR